MTKIVLYLIDDLSPSKIGLYGGGHPTPNLSGLGAAVFDNAWATPLCRPTRAEILTGYYGPRTGWLSNDTRGRPLGEIGTLAQQLRDAGWTTAVSGKWQHDEAPEELGFGRSFVWPETAPAGYQGPIEPAAGNLPGRPARYWQPCLVEDGRVVPTSPTDYGPNLCANWTLGLLQGTPGNAFVLHNEMLVHTTWLFDLVREGYERTPADRAIGAHGTFASNITQTDVIVGRLAYYLSNDVWLIVCSDNGTSGRGKGRLSKERGQRAILAVRGLGVEPGHRAQLTDFSDLWPTILGIAGLTPSPRDGLSLLPILADPGHVGRAWIYSWLEDADSVRDTGWLLDGDRVLYAATPNGHFSPADLSKPIHAMALTRLQSLIEERRAV